MKTTITKTVTIRQRPADWEHVEITAGYSEEVEYNTPEELESRTKELNKHLHRDMKKELNYCLETFWEEE